MEWLKVWQIHTHTHTSVRESLFTDPSASCTALIIDKEPSISRQPDLPNTLHTLMDTREKYPAPDRRGISRGHVILKLLRSITIRSSVSTTGIDEVNIAIHKHLCIVMWFKLAGMRHVLVSAFSFVTIFGCFYSWCKTWYEPLHSNYILWKLCCL